MAILANQKILTYDYWKIVRDLKEGDIVFDRHGKPRKITLIQKVTAPECYRVQFHDLLEVVGDRNLSFWAQTPIYRKQIARYKGVKKLTHKLKLITVEDAINSDVLYSVPTTDPIKLPHQNLPVPPFLFGFWYVNRKLSKLMIAPKGYGEMIREEFRSCGYKTKDGRKSNSTEERYFSVTPTIESHLIDVPLHRIPNNYLMGSIEQRTELLRGMLHGKRNQYRATKNQFRFTSRNYAIILQMQGLLDSLGHQNFIEHDSFFNSYKIIFKSKIPLMENQPKASIMVHNGRRLIKSVKKITGQACVHIETDGPDNSVLIGEGFIACL